MDAKQYWRDYRDTYFEFIGVQVDLNAKVYGIDEAKVTESIFEEANKIAADLTSTRLSDLKMLNRILKEDRAFYGEVSA